MVHAIKRFESFQQADKKSSQNTYQRKNDLERV